MAKNLTDMQKALLEALFSPECKGDISKAKKVAGYANGVSNYSILKSLKEEIIERTKEFIAVNGPKASFVFTDAIDNPLQLGLKERMQAAKEILDRAGVVKTENLNIEANGIFILPKIDDEKEAYSE